MALLYIYDSPQGSLEIYDRVHAQVRTEGAPAGRISHIASAREGGGIVVVEVWEDERAHDAWDEKLRQKIVAAGGPPRAKPRKMIVHNMVSASKAPA
ncbi:MAG: hypothetical protein NVS3B7_20640 [Candidatus Elarobacter sp.]